MISSKPNRSWEKWAQLSPYFAVATLEKYKGVSLDEGTLTDFFQSGEGYIETVLSWIKANLENDFHPRRCLDFGCGVGRFVIPLARRFSEVVGVDLSRRMLEEATINCTKQGLHNVILVESDDGLSKVTGKFDFINSFIVFQHISPKLGERLLNRIVDLLNDNGVAALHFTYAGDRTLLERLKYRVHASVPFAHPLLNLFRGRKIDHPPIMINRYDLNRLIRIIQEGGCEHCYVRFSNHAGLLGVVLMFQKKQVGMLL